jgi:hypothetical protein
MIFQTRLLREYSIPQLSVKEPKILRDRPFFYSTRRAILKPNKNMSTSLRGRAVPQVGPAEAGMSVTAQVRYL